jgi:hypothetical protein
LRFEIEFDQGRTTLRVNLKGQPEVRLLKITAARALWFLGSLGALASACGTSESRVPSDENGGAAGAAGAPHELDCEPGAKRCDGLVPESCGDDGTWKSGAPCAYVCARGECTGQCVPGSKSCQGLVPRSCDESGEWQSGDACDFMCAAGECTGSCAPGDKLCDGVTPKTCDATGRWANLAACEFVCSGEGECTGKCEPDTKSCDGLVPRTCDAKGAWQSGDACDYVCSGGKCTGECVPGATRCTSETTVERCSEAGFWEESPCTQICSEKRDECACAPGYEGDGETCTPLDFCAPENGGCSPNATCSQDGIVPSCTCDQGYEGDGFACSVPTQRINEGFDDVGALTGWLKENKSSPLGSTGWFQGNNPPPGNGPFPSYSGATNSYIAANVENTGIFGTINNWLVTPEITLGANTTASFFTRSISESSFPDRIEVRFCPATPCALPTDATGVGDYTVLLGSVNPNLEVGGYPTTWTKFTFTNSDGIGYSGTGRIAIRYYVTGAGVLGSNADYVAVDQFEVHAGAPAYTVGGSVTGLAGGDLELWLNGKVTLPIAADGSFTFPNLGLDSGTPYSVMVKKQPAIRTCAVTNGVGTIASANVEDVTVTCVDDPV